MVIKDILLVLRAGDDCRAQLAVASRLARENGATVEGVCLYPNPDLVPPDSFAIGKAGVADVLARREERIRQLVDPVAAVYQKTVGDHGLSHGWSAGETEVHTWAVVRQARFTDLAIVGLPADDQLARRVAESVVIYSGAPCLFVPCGPSPISGFSNVMLAWDGSRESRRAMDDGLHFMRVAAAVTIVIAHESGDTAFYETHGQSLQIHLARHGVHSELKVVHEPGTRAKDVLHAQCEALAPDLLIMGAYGHTRAGEMILGGATRTMLAKARQPVLMSH